MADLLALLLAACSACRNTQKYPAATADELKSPLWREFCTVKSDQIIVHACVRGIRSMASFVLIWLRLLDYRQHTTRSQA